MVTDLKKFFNDIAPEVAALCSSTAQDVFNVPIKSAGWNIVVRVEIDSTIACTLAASNQKFQGYFALGTEPEHIQKLFGKSAQDDMVFDAFGEYLNNLCANLCSWNNFSRAIGVLKQDPPYFTSNGGLLLFAPAIGMQGLLNANGAMLQLGFSVRE